MRTAGLTVQTGMALAALAAAGPAWAHPGHSPLPTFADGLIHPLTGLDHLAILAVGGAILGWALRDIRPTRLSLIATTAGLTGLGTATLAVAPAVALGCAGLIAAAVALMLRNSSARSAGKCVGGVIGAVLLHFLSHILALGDAPPTVGFALGFSLTSLCVMASAAAVTMRRRAETSA